MSQKKCACDRYIIRYKLFTIKWTDVEEIDCLFEKRGSVTQKAIGGRWWYTRNGCPISNVRRQRNPKSQNVGSGREGKGHPLVQVGSKDPAKYLSHHQVQNRIRTCRTRARRSATKIPRSFFSISSFNRPAPSPRRCPPR